ncbi:protein piwi-like [Condylostylus longicornis]|uniref:protein piwi-like n=1 Tax=Condylostylus longicornis TaxID=2530218 RepID=UPI00244DFEF1|nr:protein piwi-like [Condylostylus longicornis]
MCDEEKSKRSNSPVPSTSGSSRRKRDDEYHEEQPREKIRKRYTPPGQSPGASGSIKREEDRESSHSSTSSSRVIERECRKPQQTTEQRFRYEIVRTRPETVNTKQGTTGRRVQLEANYFKLLKRPEWSIYQYRVDFSPAIELIRLKRGILSEQKSLLGGYLFDGTLLYVTRKLDKDYVEIDTKSRKGDEYKIIIKFIAAVSMNQWQSLQILNLILRRAMEGLQLQLVGKNFYDALDKINLSQYRIQLWPGYITSIRQHENEILVCAEVTHKVMRTETIYDIMRQCINDSDRRGGDWSENFKKQVIGLTVLTDYNNKTYRIDDVDLTFKASMTFNMKGKSTSFVDYYYQKYQIRIRDPEQPLLASRNRERRTRNDEDNRIYLVPELCRVTGLSENMRSNQQLMRGMADYTRTNPDRRIEILKKFNRRLQETKVSQQVLKEWNMSLDRHLIQLEGRHLEPENIVFENNDKVSATERCDWSNFRGKAMYTVATLQRWVVIVPYRFKHECRDFIQKLLRIASDMHMRVERPNEINIPDDRNHAYIQAIDRAANEDPSLIMCLVPNKNVERYSTIKKKCCVERAIATQVVMQGTVSSSKRNVMSIISKIVIQMNAKLGGAPWMISLPMKGLMVIGYDICKSSRDKSKTYAALVATMDQKVKARYFSTVAQTHSSDNLSNELNLAVSKAIHEYRRSHDCLPEKIILYRDGVGNGSIQQVVEHEVKNLVEFLDTQYKKSELPPPRFTFMVVSKQINARFFLNKRNPPPGTVIDDIVTLPERYDFYLVSQSVRQGTVSPTSYNILYDTSKLSADKLQILTYKMCHLYYNWAGTTRVPAVCLYAKKLATLVGQNLHQTPNNLLEKQLYYL